MIVYLSKFLIVFAGFLTADIIYDRWIRPYMDNKNIRTYRFDEDEE